MWSWRSRNSRKRATRTATGVNPVQQLESRALLAGNVIASLNGDHLTVIGDNAANSIEITTISNQIVLRGKDSTTVNGSSDPFVIAAGTNTMSGHVHVDLGRGNDSIAISGDITFLQSVVVIGGDGNDTIATHGPTFDGPVYLIGKTGDDTMSLQNSTFNNVLVVHGNRGNDLISLSDVQLNGWTEIKGQLGNDGVSLSNVTSTGPVLGIKMGRGDDNVTIRGSDIDSFLHIKMKQGVDAVLLEGSTFEQRVHVNLGRDNDALIVRNTSGTNTPNTFNGDFSLQGGDSHLMPLADFPDGDARSIAAETVFNGGQTFRKTEFTTVPAAGTNRFDASGTGLIARAAAADTAGDNLTAPDMTATANAAVDRSLLSDGVLITKDSNITLTGVTAPGAVITVDLDNDGEFDDGTVTADELGNYSLNVVLGRRDLYTSDSNANDQLTGFQTLRIRAAVGSRSAETSVTVDLIKETNSLIRFVSTTNTGATQEYFIELFNAEAPGTVANFLEYMNAGVYDTSIIHRAPADFVIQGGGYTVNNGVVRPVSKNAAIADEFDAARGNIRGTLSMAKTGAPDSGTSEWFVNLVNGNATSLDPAEHTVFGRIVGNGMTVVDAVAALPLEDLNAALGLAAGGISFKDVPYRVPFVDFARTLTGTVTINANSTLVVGEGTKFTEELRGSLTPGDPRSRIQIGNETFIVASVTDDTHLTLVAAPASSGSGLTAKSDFANDNDFVRYSSVTEVLRIT